ncbi:MAG: DUF262 domain-containing protein, partial [Symploca sp. SIO1C4]|nr:DUF262 domain-containing protein [Symploca sp. SIO1C4]
MTEKGLTELKNLLIGDRIFKIPEYQRYYAWEKQQLEDLWSDMIHLKPGRKHYFGTLLLRKTGDQRKLAAKNFDVYEIIDGQQRMVTVIILLKQIISQFKKSNDDELKEDSKRLEEDYIKYRDVYKLELLGDDGEFFKKKIIDNDSRFQGDFQTPSQQKLEEANKLFEKKIKNFINDHNGNMYESIVKLKDKIDNIQIIRYEVEDNADAVLIFETVNDRGRPLTDLEKTKSFLMHMIYLSVSNDEKDQIDDLLNSANVSFSRMFKYFEQISRSDRGKKLVNLTEDAIQRYHLIIYQKADKIKNSPLSLVKEEVMDLYDNNQNEKCLKYVKDYYPDLETTFRTLQIICTYNQSNQIRDLLNKIFTLQKGTANFLPLLIAAWRKFEGDEKKILETLKFVEIAIFRVYSIGKRRVDTARNILQKLAYSIDKEDISNQKVEAEIKDFVNKLQDNTEFTANLKLQKFYQKIDIKYIKYLLYEYENHLNQSQEGLRINLEDIMKDSTAIDHIWAQEPSKLQLTSDLSKRHEEYKHKLGNLTLASHRWNSEWGNKPFEIKRENYKNSAFRTQRELSNQAQWGTSEIETRENKIIEFALQRWKI